MFGGKADKEVDEMDVEHASRMDLVNTSMTLQ